MDERLKESLSAMLDDQADELSVRRVLACPDQDEVRAQWQRWQTVRDLLHDSHGPDGIDTDAVDISAQVRQALHGPQADETEVAADAAVAVAGDRRKNWHWTAVAMVFAGLLVGFGMGSSWGPYSADGYVPVVSEQPRGAGAGAGVGAGVAVPEVALQRLDDAQWEQLSRYLLEHAQHNSVAAGRGAVGYARLASVSAPAY